MDAWYSRDSLAMPLSSALKLLRVTSSSHTYSYAYEVARYIQSRKDWTNSLSLTDKIILHETKGTGHAAVKLW
jgi:hypothetical protein